MPLLPIFSDGSLHDGSFIHALPFCLKNCGSAKCQQHYQAMQGQLDGFYTCPYGLSTLVYTHLGGKLIFSGLRERDSYDKKKSAPTQCAQRCYNPVLDAPEFLALADGDCALNREKQALQKKMDEVNDLLHETRKLNGQIKTECDVVWENSNDGDTYTADDLLDILHNVHIYSYIIYNRFEYFDSVLNPGLSPGSPYSAIIFKKFDKMRKLLRGYSRKNVWISLESQSTYSYKIYPSFETLLFILLENGIKYSPNNNPILVYFSQPSPDCLDVCIESTGPLCRSQEIAMLGTKGFRGEQAQLTQCGGQGIGLHFARRICELHHIRIDFSSSYGYKDHGVIYGPFRIGLHFDRNSAAG